MKMSDLRVEVPLADDAEFTDLNNGTTIDSQNNNPSGSTSNLGPPTSDSLANGFLDNLLATPATENEPRPGYANRSKSSSPSSGEQENFGDFGGSLEDLVSSFDERITQCFKNYEETTDKIAPVQVRTQEEIMNECQIWWTLTGNFGNILPIDWSKTYARKLQLPALNLREKPEGENGEDGEGGEGEGEGGGGGYETDDEDLAQALDMHSLIVAPHDLPPPQTAEQVIQEIDEIMQQSSTSEMTGSSDITMDSMGEGGYLSPVLKPPHLALLLGDPHLQAKVREVTSLASDKNKLHQLSVSKLETLQSELDSLIQAYNEALVAELAHRDELEYEKELKNAFISLLLAVQNKRRHFLNERKRKATAASGAAAKASGPPVESPTNGLTYPQFLTAVIPFDETTGPPDNQKLQALIKILKAVNEDSASVPTLLTDYILNVFCPNSQPRPPTLVA